MSAIYPGARVIAASGIGAIGVVKNVRENGEIEVHWGWDAGGHHAPGRAWTRVEHVKLVPYDGPKNSMHNPDAPDGMPVRYALLEQVKRGEITLEEAQRRIRSLRCQRERGAR